MMNDVIDFWSGFWTALPEIRRALSQNAARSGLSADAAILLTVYYEFPEIQIPVNPAITEELLKKGLVEINGDIPKVTSKGAILAKSFVGVRNANFM